MVYKMAQRAPVRVQAAQLTARRRLQNHLRPQTKTPRPHRGPACSATRADSLRARLASRCQRLHHASGPMESLSAHVGGDTPSKAVILDVLSPPEQPVLIYTREGDISFTPARCRMESFTTSRSHTAISRWSACRPHGPFPVRNSRTTIRRCSERAAASTGWRGWLTRRSRAPATTSTAATRSLWRAAAMRGRGRRIPIKTADPARGPFPRRAGRGWTGPHLVCLLEAAAIESGNFDLYARVFDGTDWSAEQQLTTDPRPDVFHRLASDRKGNLYLVWMGFRPSSGGLAQSDVLMRVRSRDRWSDEINVSQFARERLGAGSCQSTTQVVPGSHGTPIAESAAAGDYDILLAQLRGRQPGPRAYGFGDAVCRDARRCRRRRFRPRLDRVGRRRRELGQGYRVPESEASNPSTSRRLGNLRSGEFTHGPSTAGREWRFSTGNSSRNRSPSFTKSYPAIPSRQSVSESAARSGRQRPYLGLSAPPAGRPGQKRRPPLRLLRNHAARAGRRSQSWMHPALLPATTGRQDTTIAMAPGRRTSSSWRRLETDAVLPVPLPVNHEVATMALDAAGFEPANPGAEAVRAQSGGTVSHHPSGRSRPGGAGSRPPPSSRSEHVQDRAGRSSSP